MDRFRFESRRHGCPRICTAALQSSSKDLRVFHLVDACKASNRQVGRAAAGAEGRELSFAEFKASVLARLDSGSAANGAETVEAFFVFP